MNIRFFKTFSKRRNSTKQVGTATYSTHTCTLKQPTSMHDPVVQLATSEMLYTYAYIPDWSSYYFVQDVVSLHNGLVEYHLIEDVLATYKSSIGSTVGHVMYSSSNYEVGIPDPRILMGNQKVLLERTALTPVFDTNTNSGSFILTVIGLHTSSSFGFGQAYWLNQAGIYYVAQTMNSVTFMDGIASFIHGKGTDAILSCIWVPYSIPSGTYASSNRLDIGMQTINSFPTGCECHAMNEYPIVTKSFNLDVNIGSPQDFTTVEPYTTGTVYLPGIGVLDISMSDFWGAAQMTVDAIIETLTGNVQYNIRRYNDSQILQTAQCNVAAQLPVGQITAPGGAALLSSLGSAVGGAAAFVGGIAAVSPAAVLAGAGGMAAGIANTVLSANRHGSSISGGMSGCRGVTACPYIMHTEYAVRHEDMTTADYIAQRGRPCGKTVQISTLSGYVQCEGASVSGSMTEHEREEINSFLNTGFYYE